MQHNCRAAGDKAIATRCNNPCQPKWVPRYSDNLAQCEEFDNGVDDEFPNVMLFAVDVVLEWYFGVSEYLLLEKC